MAKVKDKDGNEVPGSQREPMAIRSTVVVTNSIVLKISQFGKRHETADKLPAIEHKNGDRVVVIIESMRKDGVGFACDGTVQVLTDDKK